MSLDILWADLCSHFSIDEKLNSKWIQLIKEKYGRDYFDLNYLEFKLKHYENIKSVLSEPYALLLALIFQSIFYETKNTEENLEKCLNEFSKFKIETNLEEDVCKKVIELIKSVEESFSEDMSGVRDRDYFLDINFTHLASDWKEYEDFSIKTRSEYSFLSDSSYKSLRKKVLQSFLHIPHIFSTVEFREQFEEKARRNIQLEIENL